MNCVQGARAIRAALKAANIMGVKVTSRREHYGDFVDIDAPRWKVDEVEDVLHDMDLDDAEFTVEW